MDKNISEAYIYNAYICMYYGTNFLRDTKFNNYKQHRLSDNNHNCKFLCDRYFWELFELTSGQTTTAIFFFNRAPQLFPLLQKDFKHSCKCIVISWTKKNLLISQPLRLPSNGLSSNKGVDASLLLDVSLSREDCKLLLRRMSTSQKHASTPSSPSSCSGLCLGKERPTLMATSCCSASSACSCASASRREPAVWWKGHSLGQGEVGGRRRGLLLLQRLSWKDGLGEEGRQGCGWGWLQGLQGSCRWCCSQRWPLRSPGRPPDYPGTVDLPSTAAQSPAAGRKMKIQKQISLSNLADLEQAQMKKKCNEMRNANTKRNIPRRPGWPPPQAGTGCPTHPAPAALQIIIMLWWWYWPLI